MTTLRALAEAATPGPEWSGRWPLPYTPEDAAYIAAASPAVVLALLDVVDAALNTVALMPGEDLAPVSRSAVHALRAALARVEEVLP